MIPLSIRLSSFRLSSVADQDLPSSCKLVFSCTTNRLRGVETSFDRPTTQSENHGGHEFVFPSSFVVKWTETLPDALALRAAVVCIDVMSSVKPGFRQFSSKWMCGLRAKAIKRQNHMGSLRLDLYSLLHGTVCQSLCLRNNFDNSMTSYTLSFDAIVEQPSFVSLLLSDICLQLPCSSSSISSLENSHDHGGSGGQKQENESTETDTQDRDSDDHDEGSSVHYYIAVECPTSKQSAKTKTNPKPFVQVSNTTTSGVIDDDVDDVGDPNNEDNEVEHDMDHAHDHSPEDDSLQIFWATAPQLVLRMSSLYKLAHANLKVRIYSVKTKSSGTTCDPSSMYHRPQLFKEIDIDLHDIWGCFLHPNTPYHHSVYFDDPHADDNDRADIDVGNTTHDLSSSSAQGQVSMMFMSAGALPGGQLVGGVTTDDAIIGAKPVIFGSHIPGIELFPLDAVYIHGNANEGWRQVTDSFGIIYFRHIRANVDAWKQPDEDSDNIASTLQNDDMCAVRNGLMVTKRSLYYDNGSKVHSWIHPEAIHHSIAVSEREAGGTLSRRTSFSLSTVDATSMCDMYLSSHMRLGFHPAALARMTDMPLEDEMQIGGGVGNGGGGGDNGRPGRLSMGGIFTENDRNRNTNSLINTPHKDHDENMHHLNKDTQQLPQSNENQILNQHLDGEQPHNDENAHTALNTTVNVASVTPATTTTSTTTSGSTTTDVATSISHTEAEEQQQNQQPKPMNPLLPPQRRMHGETSDMSLPPVEGPPGPDADGPTSFGLGGLATHARIVEMKWALQPRNLPGAGVEGHTLTSIERGHAALRFGGAVGMGRVRSNALHHLNAHTLRWNEVKTHGVTPEPRTGHGAVALGEDQSRLLIFGGTSQGGARNDLHMFHVASATWSPVVTTGETPGKRARMGFTASNDGGSVYVFGGRSLYRWLGGKYYDTDGTVNLFDSNRSQWIGLSVSSNSRMSPRPRSGCVLQYVNERQLILHGGYDDGDKFYDDTLIFDTLSHEWIKIPYPTDTAQPAPRESHAHSFVDAHNALVVCGGDGTSSMLSDVHVFDASMMRWLKPPSFIGHSPGSNTGAAMATLFDSRILFAGGEDGFTTRNLCYTLEVSHRSILNEQTLTEVARQRGPDAPMCVVCLDAEPQVVFLWCGHSVCCSSCAKLVNKTCPICRKTFSKIVYRTFAT